MYDDVLVATDGSDVAEDAVSQAIALARGPDAAVHAVSVTSGTDDREAAERYVAEAAEIAHEAGAAGESVVREGRPATEIIECADELDADVIVAGTRGRTGVRQTLLGSVALELVGEARRPVSTVGPDATPAGSIDEVLLATDGWSTPDAATDHALSLAASRGARLRALYVLDVESAGSDARDAIDEREREATAAVVDRADAAGVPVDRRIERGTPDEIVLEYADAETVDLLVLGTESGSTAERLVLGTVAQDVVPRATVPVLTVRSNGE